MGKSGTDQIALGLGNTVDYELEWNPAHLERLICHTGLKNSDIEEKRQIHSLVDLLSSILFHMREGTGCGMWTDQPEVIEAFIEGTKYRVALGGSNLRAAEVISELGGSALVHLVSVNEDTRKRMPEQVEWIGGKEYACCFPHIAIQFPQGAKIRANDIEITTPKANRVIYSGDIACARMPLEPNFFERAAKTQAMLLSGLDLVADADILAACLAGIQKGLKAFPERRPLVFYEHACFANERFEDMVQDMLVPWIDIYSMNEDEFQQIAGCKLDLLEAGSVLDGLYAARGKLPGITILVHTGHWALAYGPRAEEIKEALQEGMLTATTRYWQGSVSRAGMEKTKGLPLQERAKQFAHEMEEAAGGGLVCLPAAEVKVEAPTTVGLGDSFVGGFLYKYCADRMKREA